MADNIEALLAEADAWLRLPLELELDSAQCDTALVRRLAAALRATRADGTIGRMLVLETIAEQQRARAECAELGLAAVLKAKSELEALALQTAVAEDDQRVRADKAESERDEANDAYTKLHTLNGWQPIEEANQRADKAEAERDAARAALREVAKSLQYGTDHGYDDDGCQSTPLAIARRALGEEP